LFGLGQDAFATVRHGDVWFAVRQHGAFAHAGDLRSDFGQLAAECHAPDGWHPLLAARPLTTAGMDSAGPVLRTAGGRIGYPDGASLKLDRHTALIVAGGWRDVHGRWVRRGRFRFSAVAGGVRLSFPVRRGDQIRYSVFAERPEPDPHGLVDERARTSLSTGPFALDFTGGFGSSDASHLTRGTIVAGVSRAGHLAVTMRSLSSCGRRL
jgi:hypothetical protein